MPGPGAGCAACDDPVLSYLGLSNVFSESLSISIMDMDVDSDLALDLSLGWDITSSHYLNSGLFQVGSVDL